MVNLGNTDVWNNIHFTQFIKLQQADQPQNTDISIQ
jgi:hypothetical protein